MTVEAVVKSPSEEKSEIKAVNKRMETPKIAKAATTPVVPATPLMELTQVKGIGEKRAMQLKALGIDSVEALAKSSAKRLARKLKVSPKIVEKWVAGAKELAK